MFSENKESKEKMRHVGKKRVFIKEKTTMRANKTKLKIKTNTTQTITKITTGATQWGRKITTGSQQPGRNE